MKRWAKRFLGVGVLAGATYAVWRLLDERSRESGLNWTAQPFPSPPMPSPRDAPTSAEGTGTPAAWSEPAGDACPATHPLKAKLASGIYHEPGGQMYDRTVPDRCYRDAAAAEADGLRKSKR